jgi:hypothetical protein
VTEVRWSRWGAEDCIRLEDPPPGARIRVYPGARAGYADGPPMAGRLVRDAEDLCFVPRFAFVDGTAYTVTVDGSAGITVLFRPRPERPATTEVLVIHPSAAEVPRNLLRLYVHFSARMSEGDAGQHVRIVDDADAPMVGALLATEHELWDAGRQRLTVLLDPARIKRGLLPHRQVGYPLREGTFFRLVVDGGFRDAGGIPLRAGAERRYRVGSDRRERVDPERWALGVPAARTLEPLAVTFDRSLDHALLARCLHVVGPDGRPLRGTTTIGVGERSWTLVPEDRWATGSHRLTVDPVLEDLAGNSLTRVFDRDLADGAGLGGDQPVMVAFHPT